MAMRDWFTKDKGWKLFSLVLAVAIWLIVNKIRGELPLPAAGAVQKILPIGNVPVHVVPSSENVGAYYVIPPTVAVAIGGPPDLISNLHPDQVRAIVDLTESGTATPSQQSVEVSLPAGLTFLAASPSMVEVSPLPQLEQTNQIP